MGQQLFNTLEYPTDIIAKDVLFQQI